MLADPPIREFLTSGPQGGLVSKIWWDWFVRIKGYIAAPVTWILGTANRVTVTDNGDGTVTLTTPQDTHTAAEPTFGGVTLNGFPLIKRLIDRNVTVPTGYTALVGDCEIQSGVLVTVETGAELIAL
jgi:hypothetical protein